MRFSAFACALLCAASFPASADEITDHLDLGKKYYEEGDPAGSINELQLAIQDIRSQLATENGSATMTIGNRNGDDLTKIAGM